jgi:hypothetical protein
MTQLKTVGIVTGVMIIAIFVWYFWLNHYTWATSTDFVEDALFESNALLVPRPVAAPKPPANPAPKPEAKPEAKPEENNPASAEVDPKEAMQKLRRSNYWKLEYREQVVQAAFGRSWHVMNIPQKIELILSWLVVIGFSYGVLQAIRKKLLPPLISFMAVAMYGILVLTVIIPHVSVYYGVIRVMFTGWIVLAPCFVVGVADITKRKYLPAALLVLLYASATSGWMHSLFGIVK